MVTRRSARGRLVGGFVVLAMVVASLVLATMISVAASPEEPRVQPLPVPTPLPVPAPARVQQAVSAPLAVISQRPAPVPAPMPPGSVASPQGQANQAPAFPLLGLSTSLALGLIALRWRVGLPAGRAAFGSGRAAAACQECGS